ncbi:MAG TPA: hypothetical protein DEP45_02605 [Armatimonadetes bacterium]|nr:hypothetical protein [Armatimonadota bacterium]
MVALSKRVGLPVARQVELKLATQSEQVELAPTGLRGLGVQEKVPALVPPYARRLPWLDPPLNGAGLADR